MRLTRVIWVLLALALAAALVATWLLTRQAGPEPQWVGAVSVLAGDGRDGWLDGPGDEARFSEPFGLAAAPDGRFFVSDAGSSHRIRQIAVDGRVSTSAGGGRGFVDGRGSEARFATPSGIALAPDGTLVVADTGNHAIRRLTPDGVVTTVAGDGTPGYADGPPAQARFNAPVGVAVDAAGRIIVADTYNDAVRVIDPDGHVRTLAGGGRFDGGAARPPGAPKREERRRPDSAHGDGDMPAMSSAAGYVDGPGVEARFDTPCGIAVAPDGRVLVADTGNGLIRAIDANGTVSTIPASIVGYERPIAIVAAANGDLYVVDERGAIVLLPAHGDARLLAGGAAGFADGVGSEARFRRPSSVALIGLDVRARGSAFTPRLVVADAGNAMIRSIAPAFEGCREAGRCPTGASAWPWTTPAVPLPRRPRQAPAFDVESFTRVPLLWPVYPLEGPHEVAGTFGEARGEAGQERFHAGLDVRENQGTPVRAVRDGIVASPVSTTAFDTLNESLRIGPLTYVHIRAGRRAPDVRRRPGTGVGVPRTGRADRARVGAGLPPPPVGYGGQVVRHEPAEVDLQRFAPVYDADGVLTRMRAKRGAFFTTGDEVGTVNAFNHVHLNVGWSGEEHNPLRFRLVQFSDSIAPSIAPAGVRLFDEAWTPLNPDRVGPMRGAGRRRRPSALPPLEPVVVRGRVRIVVDAWDQADGNTPNRRLGLYAVGYSVPATGGPAAQSSAKVPLEAAPAVPWVASQVFDHMRRDADAAKQVYASGSGIPVYGARRTRFLYVATTSYHDGIATEGFWDTRTVTPGEHVLRVFVQDFSGNTTSRDLRVLVVP